MKLTWLGMMLCIILLLPVLTMLLWNWLMPVIFGLTTINYFQAFDLMCLSTLLFYRTGSNN